MGNYDKELDDLIAWQKARVFRNKMRVLVKTFPRHEQFDLTQQLRRSSRAVCAALAEGHGRYHYQENIQSCRIARGELIESYNHLTEAFDCGYISEEELAAYKSETYELKKIINGLIRYLQKQKKKNS